jgi:hypothetical protein
MMTGKADGLRADIGRLASVFQGGHGAAVRRIGSNFVDVL